MACRLIACLSLAQTPVDAASSFESFAKRSAGFVGLTYLSALLLKAKSVSNASACPSLLQLGQISLAIHLLCRVHPVQPRELLLC